MSQSVIMREVNFLERLLAGVDNTHFKTNGVLDVPIEFTLSSYTEDQARELDLFLTPRPFLRVLSEPVVGSTGTLKIGSFRVAPEFAGFFSKVLQIQFGSDACKFKVKVSRQNAARYLGSLAGTWFKHFADAVYSGSTFIPVVDEAHPLFGRNGLLGSFLPSNQRIGHCSRPEILKLIRLGTKEYPLSAWGFHGEGVSLAPERLAKLERTKEWTICSCGNLSTFDCGVGECKETQSLTDIEAQKIQDEHLVISRNGKFFQQEYLEFMMNWSVFLFSDTTPDVVPA
jgi:hypothetical protein